MATLFQRFVLLVLAFVGWRAAGAGEIVLVSDDQPLLEQLSVDDWLRPAQFQQPLAPSLEAQAPTRLPSAAATASSQLTASLQSSPSVSFSTAGYGLPAVDFASNQQAFLRATTDTGNLLGGLPNVTSVGTQSRNPVVTEPRVRGSRVGSLAASGSYWVPARIDLDTAVSKIDSRIIEGVAVVPGPYSALYGPDRNFVDFELLRAPRFESGFQNGGATSLEYKTNGEQWHGRQSFYGGDNVWGYRAGYSHRTGSDYNAANGQLIPSSYKSREFDGALGAQLTSRSNVDFNYLRLDQTDVELAGQAFDIDWLVTDGYDMAYVLEGNGNFDRLVVESWYNRTRFEGSAQRPGKRAQFPAFNDLNFTGNTDVDSMSTGYRAAFAWEGNCGEKLTAGSDLRYVKQELNEITSGRRGFDVWDDQNSPVPRSHRSNPGLFVEYQRGEADTVQIRTGGRVDWNSTNVEEELAELGDLGVVGLPAEDFLGTTDFDQDDLLGLGFLAADVPLHNGWAIGSSVGYAERAPNLTERYAIEPFMFLIQNGLNTVTGDPLLDKERTIQVDVRISKNTERFRGSVTGYHAWIHDYITFEAMSTVPFPPNGQLEQINLKYVNTDLATLWGVEAKAEYDLTRHVVPFATLRYVEGTDEDRNGSFATMQASGGGATSRDFTMARGAFSGLGGGATEALPGILPLEARLGFRIQSANVDPTWGIELSARIVDNQDRVASSLMESPTPGFTTYDWRGFWKPTDSLSLIAGVENITDKLYREHFDFRSVRGITQLRPGTNAYFGAELTY